MPPFFSIIIPVYNCEKTISQTLLSVLSQTINSYEVIIIDDCSTDNTFKKVEDFESKFENIIISTNRRNVGVAESRNIGINISRGHYIAFLDGDDVWECDKLEKQFNAIKKTECDICCTSYSFINENSIDIKSVYVVPNLINYKMLLKQNYIGCSTVAVKKELLLHNQMDRNFQHEDYALWLKLARSGAKIIGITEPLVKYRILSNSRSYNKVKAAKGRMSIYMDQEELGLLKSLYYFIFYAINGLKKKLL